MRLIRRRTAARNPRRLRGRRPPFPPKPDFVMSKTLLQINTVVNSGSTGRIAEEIGRTAIEAGWRSVIAYGRNPRPSASELIRVGNDLDVRLHGLRSRVFDDHGFGSRRATEAFIRKAEALAPDVVHLHNVHGYYLNIDVLFRWLARSGVPVVWTLHDCWPFTGHCGYYTRAGCDRWLTGCFSCPQKRGYPASFVFDRSRKNWERKRELFSSVKNLTLVPVSDWLAGEVRKSFLGDKKIVRIHNGTDTETFSPKANGNAVREKYGLGERFVALGCASVWDARKGLTDFLRLREKFSENELSVVLVGLSEAQIAELPRGVVGIRRTESIEELAALYSAADLFFNPTYEDNFPTVNIESLACGTPVCTYRTGGSPEAVDGSTGFVVDQGELDGVLSAIAEIRSRGKAAYSAACRSRALACFRKEDRWAEYLRLYEAELRS